MSVKLIKAEQKDLPKILTMQKAAFQELLRKYEDTQTNPASETLSDLKSRMGKGQETYFISFQDRICGALTVIKLNESSMRLSRLFILPDHQNRGLAQAALIAAENRFSQSIRWELTTIKQESKLTYLYEKAGYKRTGFEKGLKADMTLVQFEKVIRREERIDV